MRLNRCLLATICFLSGVACLRLLPAADSAEPRLPADFQVLFNGENLDGWYGHNPHDTANVEPAKLAAAIDAAQKDFRAHWRVDNGELVNDGHGPYATTAKKYGDIDFYLDYKTVAQADSGIYLRATPQVQIWDYTKEGGKWNIGADKGSGGLFNNRPNTAGQAPLVLADKPFGEWNQFRISQLGARTTVYLNGKLVVDNAVMENFWDEKRQRPLPAKGAIHLQTHGGEIRWRNIFVREVPAEEANVCAATMLRKGSRRFLMAKTFLAGKGPSTISKSERGPLSASPGRGASYLPLTSTMISLYALNSSSLLVETTAWRFATRVKVNRI